MSSGTADSGANEAHPFEESKTSVVEAADGLRVRAADEADASAVARILVQAFPGLYRSTFGDLGMELLTFLLAQLYLNGNLSLEITLVAERAGHVVGLVILHIGKPIGRGGSWTYGRLLLRRLGLFQALRAFFGGLGANALLNRRIPSAPDLAYIEALVVEEGERGKGIGTHLLEAAIDWTRVQRRSRIALHVLQSNAGAQRLYERMGFRPWVMTPTRRVFDFVFARRAPTWSALLLVRPV